MSASVSAALLGRVLAEFGATAQDSDRPRDAQSGAAVRRVRTASGRPGYLKATPASLGVDALIAARRELRFYRDIAPQATFRTPELLAGHDDSDGVALLLGSAGDPVPVRSYTPTHWAALGAEIAAVHTTPPPGGTDWQRPDPLLSTLSDPDRKADYWRGAIPELPRILDRAEVLAAQLMALPTTWTHGDCHTGNVVFHQDRPTFCDWPTAGRGRPAADLAFLNVRAAPTGITAPPELLAAYLDRTGFDRGSVTRALLAEELAVFLFHWPPFADRNTPAAVAHVTARVRLLSDHWLRTLA